MLTVTFAISLKKKGPAYFNTQYQLIFNQTEDFKNTHPNELRMRHAEHRGTLLETRRDVDGEVLVRRVGRRRRIAEALGLVWPRVENGAEVV